MIGIPDMQELHSLLAVVEREFRDGLAGQNIVLKLTPEEPLPHHTERAAIGFKALQESGGRITEDNVRQIVPTIYYADKATTIMLIPNYLRALLSLADKHADDARFVDGVNESIYIVSARFGEMLHGENRDEIHLGKPSVNIRLSNAKIYKTYMTRGMRKALKAYLIAWFDYFTHTYAAKLNLRRQWFHNSWL